MIKVTVNNSYSSISGLTPEQHKSLSKTLSYAIDANSYFFSKRFGPKRRSLLDKKGNFPSGLLYLVEQWLETFTEYEIDFIRVKPKKTSGMFNIIL